MQRSSSDEQLDRDSKRATIKQYLIGVPIAALTLFVTALGVFHPFDDSGDGGSATTDRSSSAEALPEITSSEDKTEPTGNGDSSVQGSTGQPDSDIWVCKALIIRPKDQGVLPRIKATVQNESGEDVLLGIESHSSGDVRLLSQQEMFSDEYAEASSLPISGALVWVAAEVTEPSDEFDSSTTDQLTFNFRNSGTQTVTATITSPYVGEGFPTCD